MKTVFVDVDTQIDFLFPAGGLYVPGAESIIPRIAELNRYAVAQKHSLISTMDAHSENDPEFRVWARHCVAGTAGQQKPAVTLVPGQRFVLKITTDPFADGQLDRMLEALQPNRYVVYGVVTEICVEAVVRGLMRRNAAARTELVTDAVRHLDPDKAEMLSRELTAAGGRLVTAADVTGAP